MGVRGQPPVRWLVWSRAVSWQRAWGARGSSSEAEVVQDPVWASLVEAYVAAWSAANAIGFTNGAPFGAPTARVDMRELNGFEGTGTARDRPERPGQHAADAPHHLRV